jgi:N-acetylmuramoyl-L-alanine amidase
VIRLAIVVGHTRRAPGAYAEAPIDAHEYDWNGHLAELMAAHVDADPECEAMIFTRDEGGIVGAYRNARDWGADAAMELHFNAASPQATGTETLYVSAQSRPLAQAVQDATLGVLGLRDRGIKTPLEASGGRGQRSLTQMAPKPSILTEPFFGSNAGDARTAQGAKAELAKAQADAALAVLRSLEAEDHWTVTASSLNVRGGPGLAYDRLSWGPLAHGTEVEVVAWDGAWALIRSEHGRGFVHGGFLA